MEKPLTYYLNSPYGRLPMPTGQRSVLNGRPCKIIGESRRRGMVRVKFTDVKGEFDVTAEWLSLTKIEPRKGSAHRDHLKHF